MTQQKKNDTRIEALIRSYGADFDRWPATEGLGRPQLDPGLATLQAEEKVLDAHIAAAPSPPPSPALHARILAIPRQESTRTRGVYWLLTGFWRPAGIAVGALMIGVMLGQMTLRQTSDVAVADSDAALLAALVLGPAENLAEFSQ